MLTYDDGMLTVCNLINMAPPGAMPAQQLQKISEHFFGEKMVGYGRQYAAMGVNEQVDMLVRIWRDASIRIGMYAVLEGNIQYRIDNVQQLLDDDGLRVTDLTLRRLDSNYDVKAED